MRIEDDYIATDKGVEWISRAPREIAEVEALMRRRTPDRRSATAREVQGMEMGGGGREGSDRPQSLPSAILFAPARLIRA